MLVVPSPLFVEGVWGPYADVLLSGYWLLEAGQSATGKLLDHIITSHPSYRALTARLTPQTSIHEEIHVILQSMTQPGKSSSLCRLTTNIHIWPDFHGNRSPLADPNLRGMVCKAVITSIELNPNVFSLDFRFRFGRVWRKFGIALPSHCPSLVCKSISNPIKYYYQYFIVH